MKPLIELQKRLLPDLLTVLQKRFQILRFIQAMEPVGRRSLAASLGLTERVLRSEVEFLKQQKLLISSTAGMSLTEDGRELVCELQEYIREIIGIDEMEASLKGLLGINKVIIVSGDSEESPWVKEELGKACVTSIKNNLTGKNTIAVTGGTTMAAVADMMTSQLKESELLFVPARGGIGEDVNYQANTICSKMAEKTKSKHRVLYVPDQVSKEMYQSMIKDPEINGVLQLIKSANMVLHGIGDAITMAKRRKTNAENIEKLEEAAAVGEAFGYYFNEAGEVVHKVQTIGIQLKNLEKVEHVVAIAGGASKAKAIRAYMKQAPKTTVFITDEAAATELLQG